MESYSKYVALEMVLHDALKQAAVGKGSERHDPNEEPFTRQQILWIERNIFSFALGQAVKKIEESQRLSNDMAINELLGAIVYIAARIIYLKERKGEEDWEKTTT
jgi:hypothetical protein